MLVTRRADVLRWTLLGALGAASTFSCAGSVESSSGDGDGTVGDGDSAGDGDVPVGDGDVPVGDGDVPVGDGDVPVGDGDGVLGIPACTNPVDQGGGFFSCDEGYTHRDVPSDCAAFVARPEAIGDPTICTDPVGTGCCVYDADCAGPLEYCQLLTDFGGGPGSWCATGCGTDADCGDGMICQCGEPRGQCVTAVCTGDSDCEGEARCASFVTDDGCGPRTEYTCQTVDDECASAQDCGEGMECDGTGGVRQCLVQEFSCAIGRPFIVSDAIRVAPLAERIDWATSVTPELGGTSAEERVALGEAWEEVAQMEHASIAAFARFSLQILSLGAPAELIELTNQALMDETLHARLSFGLASAYRGRPVGPSPLDVSGALVDLSLENIVVSTIIEGCAGETAAALEAAEAAALCEDPVVREILERIATDESRHAELAWRFLSWTLQAHPELSAFTKTQFALLLAEENMSGAHLEVSAGPLAAYGVLSQERRVSIRRSALREVVSPCARQLFARTEIKAAESSAAVELRA